MFDSNHAFKALLDETRIKQYHEPKQRELGKHKHSRKCFIQKCFMQDNNNNNNNYYYYYYYYYCFMQDTFKGTISKNECILRGLRQ